MVIEKGAVYMSKYHLSPVMNISGITISVTNISQSIKFYKEIVGLTLLEEDSNSAVFGGEKPILTLIENKDLIKNNQKLGLYHFALLVPNRQTLATLFRRLLTLQYPITGLSDHLVSEALYFDDPDGNGIEVFWDKSPDGWVTDELGNPIFTQPIDYNELFADSDAEFMKPLPKNVLMGHLHLHVGNLVDANNFFVGILGFQTVLSFRGSAEFTSDNGYHHHLAYNLWARTKEVRKESPGLLSYDVLCTSEKYESIKANLIKSNISYKEEDNVLIMNDPNQTEVRVRAY